jgi:hypothetical protein
MSESTSTTATVGLLDKYDGPAGALRNAMQRVIDEAASGAAVSAAFSNASPATVPDGALRNAMQRVIDEAASGAAVSAAFSSSVEH